MKQNLTIAIGCDHIVTPIKNAIKAELTKQGHQLIDCGTYNSVRTHYPLYGRAVALEVVKKNADIGIVICGTGVGITNSANKVKGARCMLAQHPLSAKIAKENYNANIIGIGGRIVGIGLALELISVFINSKYNGNNENKILNINNKIKNLKDDKNLFINIINDWHDGVYTNGEKQVEICMPNSEK